MWAGVPGGVGDPGDAARRGAARGGGPGLSRAVSFAAAGLAVGLALSVKIALANIVLGLAYIAWLVALARGEQRLRAAAIYLPLAAYVVASLLAVVFSQDPRHSVHELGDLATLLIVPMVVSLVDTRRWDRVVKALAAMAAMSSLVGLWQYLHGASDLSHRLRGLTTHYMTFSGWTLLVILLLIGDIAFHPDRRRLWWSAPVVVLATVAVLLSFTRNAWVGLAVGLVLLAAVWRPRLFLLYPVLAVGLAVVLPEPVLARMVSIVDLRQQANYDRLCMVTSGIQMVQDEPLVGVGLGMVKRRYPVYRRDDAPRWTVPHLHNNVLQLAAERGAVGLSAYLAVLLVFMLHTWRALRDAKGARLAQLTGCFLAVAGITAAGLFEYNWGDSEVWILTLTCLGVPWALAPEAAP